MDGFVGVLCQASKTQPENKKKMRQKPRRILKNWVVVRNRWKTCDIWQQQPNEIAQIIHEQNIKCYERKKKYDTSINNGQEIKKKTKQRLFVIYNN